MSSSLSFSTEELYALDELSPDRPLLLNMTFYGLLPYYGVSYVDDSGETISYSINMSGKDGSVILTEFLPYTQCGTASNGLIIKNTKAQSTKIGCAFSLPCPIQRRNAAGRQARQRKSAAFMEKTPDGKIIALDKFTWQRYNNDKKTWKGAILFNE